MMQIIKTDEIANALTNDANVEHVEKNVYKITLNDSVEIIEVLEFNDLTKEIKIRHKHTTYELALKKNVDLTLDKMGIKPTLAAGNKDIKAPMPGKVLNVMVNEGDTVVAGTPILVLEAMKMENVLKAEIDGKVKKITAETGKNVDKNQILVELDLA